MMRRLLKSFNNTSTSNFVDDIQIATKTYEEHLTILPELLSSVAKVDLTPRLSRCLTAYEQSEFSGHNVAHGHVSPEQKNLDKKN